jgi:lipid A 4'-phosphatase
MASRRGELKWVVGIGALLAAAFVLFPGLDLAASGLFFRDGAWLLEPDSPWLAPLYRGVPWLGRAILLVLLVLWLLGFSRRLPRLRARRATLGFLLAAALLGPTLLVHAAIKEYSGRARPVEIQPFGGTREFTPAFVPADQCRDNCAFVSGHVAMASFLMAFGWLAAPAVRRRWLLAGVAAAGLMGLARMLPGAHFLSDAIFAWYAVYFSLWLTEWLFRRLGWLPRDPVPAPAPAAGG